MKTDKPNAQEKAFLESVAELATDRGLGFLSKEWSQIFTFQIHHVKGRTYKQNKVKIGHYFILPLPVHLHDVNHKNEFNVTYFKNNFCAKYGSQVELFNKLLAELEKRGYQLPPLEVIESIRSVRA